MVSGETHPCTAWRHTALIEYFLKARWIYILVSKLLKTVDPEMWKQYWTRYQRLRMEGKVGDLDDGGMACFSSHVCLINATAKPHRDGGDVMRGVAFTCPSGTFKEGGEVGFLDLSLRFDQEAGNILMAPSAASSHLVMLHYDGDRYLDVCLTKEFI